MYQLVSASLPGYFLFGCSLVLTPPFRWGRRFNRIPHNRSGVGVACGHYPLSKLLGCPFIPTLLTPVPGTSTLVLNCDQMLCTGAGVHVRLHCISSCCTWSASPHCQVILNPDSMFLSVHSSFVWFLTLIRRMKRTNWEWAFEGLPESGPVFWGAFLQWPIGMVTVSPPTFISIQFPPCHLVLSHEEMRNGLVKYFSRFNILFLELQMPHG